MELPGSNPVRFDRGRSIGTTLDAWPAEHVVKCLVPYHPDDPDRASARAGGADPRAVRRRAGERPRAAARDHSAEGIGRATTDTVLRALKRLYNLGIYPEWWKLEPMTRRAVAARRRADRRARPAIAAAWCCWASMRTDRHAGRRVSESARASRSCRGFAVGRTIFQEPAGAWLAGAIDDAELKRRVRANFESADRRVAGRARGRPKDRAS